MPDTGDPAVSCFFSLRTEAKDLGYFSTCDGLSFEVQLEQREEGGNSFYVHQLVKGLKYTNIKLTRPVNKDTVSVVNWVAEYATKCERTTAEIVLYTFDGKPLLRWNVEGAIPVKWQGPSLTAESPKTAMETLELAHHGFTAELA